jgi:hypothetical protein
MTRLLAMLVLVGTAAVVFADPTEDALRAQRYHDRLQQVGSGPSTSIWVLLRDGESLKGTIEYLNATEVGIRDDFGHLRPVPLIGLVDFTARNQQTGVKAASTNRWRRAARLWWRRVNGANFDGWMASI